MVNYFSDRLMAARYVEAVHDAHDSVEFVCEACIKPKSLREYFFMPLRCAQCKKHRWRIPLVYLVMLGMSFWLWTSQAQLLDYLVGIVLTLYFGVVVVIDMEHRLILHPVSLVGAVLGLAFGIWQHGWSSTLLGGIAGFCMMLALFYFGGLFARVVARIRGEALDEVALGFGDVNLAGVLGLLLGWPGIIGGLVLAILFGGIVSLFYIVIAFILRRYQPFAAIPYGPFLIASAIFLLFFRDVLLTAIP